MEEQLQACNMQFLSISTILVLSILGLILGRNILKKVPGFTKVLKMLTLPQNPVTINLQREVTELRRATMQIAKDWMEMTSIMTAMKDQQYSFIRRLDNDFVSMSDFLQNSVKVTLEEECIRNDQRFNKMHRMIEVFRDEFLGIKDMIERQGELMEQARERPAAVVDGWSQTERDMVVKRRTREAPIKSTDGASADNEVRPIFTAIKKALAEFLKEVKKYLSLQREEGMADMKVIFKQLTEDKEEIKCTIESAFSTATHQTQKNFEQFGLVGGEAMKCMQALNEKSDNYLAARFQEFGDKLVGVFGLLKGLNFDVSSIKQILDNIDGQFDEIYQKLELSCQKNTDHCEEVTNRIQKTAEEWSEKSSNLDQISKKLGNVTEGIKEMLSNLNSLISCKTVDSTGMHVQQYPPNNMNISSDVSLLEDAILANKNIPAFEQLSGPEGFSALVGMVHTCYGKLNSLKDQIEEGTTGIRQSTETLDEKLDFLKKLVEDSVENLKNLNVQETNGNPNLQQKTLNRDLKEFISNVFSLDLSTKDEENPKSGDFPKLIGVAEENAEPVMNSRYLNVIPKSSGFYFKGMDSDKTSIVSVVENDVQETQKLRSRTKE